MLADDTLNKSNKPTSLNIVITHKCLTERCFVTHLYMVQETKPVLFGEGSNVIKLCEFHTKLMYNTGTNFTKICPNFQ